MANCIVLHRRWMHTTTTLIYISTHQTECKMTNPCPMYICKRNPAGRTTFLTHSRTFSAPTNRRAHSTVAVNSLELKFISIRLLRIAHIPSTSQRIIAHSHTHLCAKCSRHRVAVAHTHTRSQLARSAYRTQFGVLIVSAAAVNGFAWRSIYTHTHTHTLA